MQKQLLLGVEAIAQGALTAEFQAYMPIPVLLRQKSPNIFRILKRLSPVMYTGHGQPTKRRPWNRLWECLTPAKEPWYV